MLDVHLHGFGDASRVVYGAVVYVRSVCRHDVKVSFVDWEMLYCTCKTNYGTKVRIVGLHLVVEVDCVHKKGSCRVAECSKCICGSDS